MDRMLCSSKDVGTEVMVEWRKRDGLRKFVVVREGGRTERGSRQGELLFTAMGNGCFCQALGLARPFGLSAELLFRNDQEPGRSSKTLLIDLQAIQNPFSHICMQFTQKCTIKMSPS
jgi:hypothetical protein